MDRIFGLFARIAKPVDFDSLDDEPVDLVFLLLAPEGAGADHLKALARIARLLRDPEKARNLRASDEADTLYELLVNSEQAPTAAA